jgi:hypothetical protein
MLWRHSITGEVHDFANSPNPTQQQIRDTVVAKLSQGYIPHDDTCKRFYGPTLVSMKMEEENMKRVFDSAFSAATSSIPAGMGPALPPATQPMMHGQITTIAQQPQQQPQQPQVWQPPQQQAETVTPARIIAPPPAGQ